MGVFKMKSDVYLYGKEKVEFLPKHLLGPYAEIKGLMIRRLEEHHQELLALRPLDVKEQCEDVLEAIRFWEVL
jgi:hypothetical protein